MDKKNTKRARKNELFLFFLKLFATSAVFALALNMTSGLLAHANVSYSAEVSGAFDYAHSKKVTTNASVELANPYGKAIRAHVAKMISNWALDVMDRKPDSSITPNFSDIANQSVEMKGYIVKAAQQKLMGQGGSTFRPLANVSRAEFGTVLSRALYGDKNNGGTPYYKNHLEALKAAGIMNNLSNPERPVQRYEIWLMLKRADATTKLDNDATKDLSFDQLMKCLSDMANFDKCVADAKGDDKKDEDKKDDKEEDTKIVKNGDLNVSIKKSSKVISVPAKGTITFGKIKFDSDETITVNGLDIVRGGLGSYKDVKGVWLEKDGVRISTRGYVSSDDTASVSFSPALKIKSDDTFDLVAELNGSVGNEHFLEVTKVESTAKDVELDAKTSTVRTTNYTVADLSFDPMNTNGASYKLGDSETFELGKFFLRNDDTATGEKNVEVKSVVLRNNGNGDLENLSDITVYRNGKDLKAEVSNDGKYLTLVLKNVIDAGEKAIYTINAKVDVVDSTAGDTYQFELRKDSDVVAVETSTDFRTTLTYVTTDDSSTANINESNTLGKYEIAGGSILFSNDTSLTKNVDASAGDDDVVLMKGEITPKEAIMLEDITKIIETKAGLTLNDISKVKLRIGSTSIVGELLEKDMTKTTSSVKFEGQFNINKKATVELTVNLKDQAKQGGTVEIKNSLTLGDFVTKEYQSTQNNVNNSEGVGQISTRIVTIQSDSLNVSKTSNATEITVVQGDSSEKNLYEGKVYINNDNTLTLDDAKIDLPADFANGKASVSFQIGNKMRGPFNTDAIGDVLFNSLGFKLEKDVKETVKVSINVNNVAVASYPSIKLVLNGTNEQGNKIDTKNVNLPTIKVVAQGNATTLSTNMTKKNAIAEGTRGNEVASFDLTVKNEELNLNKVVVNVTDASDRLPLINNASIEYKKDGKVVKVGDLDIDDKANTLTLKNISNVSMEPGTYTFVVKSDFGTLTDAPLEQNVPFVIDSVDVTFRGTNGVVNASANNLGFNDLVVRAVPTLSKAELKANTVNLIKMNVLNPKTSLHTVRLKGFGVNLVGNDWAIDPTKTVLNLSLDDGNVYNLENSLAAAVVAANAAKATADTAKTAADAAKTAADTYKTEVDAAKGNVDALTINTNTGAVVAAIDGLTNTSTGAKAVNAAAKAAAKAAADGDTALTAAKAAAATAATNAATAAKTAVYSLKATDTVTVVAGKTIIGTIQAADGLSLPSEKTGKIKVNSIVYEVNEDGNKSTYTLDVTNAANIANWASFINQING